MTLKDITVKKFIDAYQIINADHYDTETDRDIALLACLYDKPEDFFLNMSFPVFNEYRRKLEVINLDKVEGRAAKYIKVNGKTYAPVYNFKKLSASQFIDVTHFCKDPEKIIENLPKILAAFCLETKKTLFGRKLIPYDLGERHEEVSKELEDATMFDAYSIALFFYHVWNGSLKITGGYLVQQILKKKEATKTNLTANEQAGILNILETYGDGITARKISRRLKT